MAIQDDLPPALLPWLTHDLRAYAESIGTMFTQVEAYSEDTPDVEGWVRMLDPDEAPAEALPHLAMYVGERLRAGITEAQMREWIKDAPNQRRGTIRSIVAAAQRSLTGQRTVLTKERAAGSTEDHLEVVTLAGETPNSAQVVADVKSVMPADIVLVYGQQTSPSWASVMTGQATWAAFATTYPTWAHAAASTGGYTTWTRED